VAGHARDLTGAAAAATRLADQDLLHPFIFSRRRPVRDVDGSVRLNGDHYRRSAPRLPGEAHGQQASLRLPVPPDAQHSLGNHHALGF
jgi:hypothetical protein